MCMPLLPHCIFNISCSKKNIQSSVYIQMVFVVHWFGHWNDVFSTFHKIKVYLILSCMCTLYTIQLNFHFDESYDSGWKHQLRHQHPEKFVFVSNSGRVVPLHEFALDPVRCQNLPFGRTFIQSAVTLWISFDDCKFAGGRIGSCESEVGRFLFPRSSLSTLLFPLSLFLRLIITIT